MKKPVAIYTLRNGNPFVLFGKHYGAEVMHTTVSAYYVEDGPDIAKWASLFDRLEQDGISITT